MQDEPKEEFEYFGTYPNWDAEPLLEAFEKNDIRFECAVDASHLKAMNPLAGQHGGSFGNSAGIAIAVHIEDVDRAVEIRQKVFKIEV